jgi:hypothetical protein
LYFIDNASALFLGAEHEFALDPKEAEASGIGLISGNTWLKFFTISSMRSMNCFPALRATESSNLVIS